VVATAGHVDHGKTSLVHALTGTDTDRLPDEKRRGISIELGFAELPEAGISFIDVPGHKKLVHAMIAGVGGVDGVLLVVAADDAVMPQTREHLHVCALLGIRRVVVALTKTDLVDAEMLELAEADVRSTLESMGLEARAVIGTSVVTQQGLAELKRALTELAHDVAPRGESQRLWLPIDRVFSIKGAGTVVTGTLTRGSLSTGSTVWVAGPSGLLETPCRAIEVHGASVDEARAPTRVAVNLARVEVAQISRGDVLTLDAELPVTRRLDAALTALPGTERALSDRSPVIAYVGTARVNARITRIGDGLYHLSLEAPLPCQGGVGIVLRGFRSTRDHGAVLAGGRVLDAAAPPLPKRRDRAAWERRAAMLAAVAREDWAEAVAGWMQIAAPRPIVGSRVERRFGLEPLEISRWLTGKKRRGPADALALRGSEMFTTGASVEALTTQLVAEVERYHAAHPHDPGLSLETLRATLVTRAGKEVTDLALERAVKTGRLLTGQGTACLPEFAKTAGPQARAAAQRVLAELEAAALDGASEAALVTRLATDGAEVVKSALTRLAGENQARRLTGIWFAESAISELRRKVVAHLEAHGKLTVPELKDLAGVSRKQAIPLLEQLDREGTTRRQGDERVLGAAGKR